MEILDQLNKYSNLILIFVTTAYVILTWRMVVEMRHTREEEVKPLLVATLIPFGMGYVKLRIYNTGHGPAINTQALIRLEPEQDAQPGIWIHSALVAGAHEDFRLPGSEFKLEKLAAKYDKVAVELQWMDVDKHKYTDKYAFDLKSQWDGLSNAGLLLRPDDIETQLGKIRDELSNIRKHLEKMDRANTLSDLLSEHQRQQGFRTRLAKKINGLLSGMIHR